MYIKDYVPLYVLNISMGFVLGNTEVGELQKVRDNWAGS